MRVSTVFKIAALAAGLLAWCVSSADECTELRPDSSGNYQFEFPRVVSNFALAGTQGADGAANGMGAAYRTGGGTLGIIVALPPGMNLPDGIESAALEQQFEVLKNEISNDERFERVILQGERSRAIAGGAIPVREAAYMMQRGDFKVMTFIYLGAKYGRFITIRMMLEQQKWKDAPNMTESVLQSLGSVFCQSFDGSVTGGSPGGSSQHPQILAAVERLLNAATVYEAYADLNTVTTFAANEPAMVAIAFDESFYQESGNADADQFLIAYFIAGATKFDLENPHDKFDPLADIPSAIRAMIKGYNNYTIENAWFVHPFVENLARIESAGDLERWVQLGKQ